MPFRTLTQAEPHPPMTFDPALDLTHRATQAAREYWEARRAERVMPARCDLDHAGMRNFIAHVGLIACSDDETPCPYRVRLAGSEWEAVFGPMTGRCLSEFLGPDIEDRWRQVFDSVRLERKALKVSTRVGFKSKTWLEAEMFVAPLSEDGETVSMLFLCFSATNLVRQQALLSR